MVGRFSLFVILLFVLPSFHLFSQTKITYRPQYDDSLSARPGVYPFKVQKRPRIGIVLSGGGARGTAQIGVLKALEENHIPIDFISSTSIGAIIGGLYASGYTSTEIESLALETNWDELLSLSDEAQRTDLAIDQKLADDWSFLVVRFDGLQPVLPHAISTGQRLTNFLSEKTLQGIYHPDPDFNDLKVPFRAVTTDLISGQRVILDRGSLAEALRASATVPLLFIPLERDSLQLVDGGLITNIPVDVAKEAGCDIVVAVNTTSGLRRSDELQVPWETADQIMGIMMQLSNREQLKQADVTITPAVGRHLSSYFYNLNFLIDQGYRSTLEQVDSIKHLYEHSLRAMDTAGGPNRVFENVQIEFTGTGVPDSILLKIKNESYAGRLSSEQIRKHIRWLFGTGNLKDVSVDVYPDESPVRIIYHLDPNPELSRVEFSGNNLVASESLAAEFQPVLGRWLNRIQYNGAIERVLRLYRREGYSLARVSGTSFNESTGVLRVTIDEGVIGQIVVHGAVRAEDSFVLRELDMKAGDVFRIENAKRGIRNINSTKVFEYIYLEVTYENQKPKLTIRLEELPSQLIRMGMRLDDERKFQGTVDIRDENFRGIGAELGLTLSAGGRNGFANLEFKTNRLFSSRFAFNIAGFFNIFNSYVYADDPSETRQNHWDRRRLGEYSDIRLGGKLIAGTQLERLGNATIEWSLQDSRIRSVSNMEQIQEHYRLSLVKVGTVIDTRNVNPFPTSGINLNLSYEFASRNFLSDVGYNAVRAMYESYSSWGERSTFHPRVSFGFADVTMPLGQQFRLGGRESMFGTREDDRRGRQMLAINLEYRYKVPVRFLFDTYIKIRYDLGTISEIPEQIKFSSFRHGVGAEIAFDTPVGQAAFGAGKSFFFSRDIPGSPVQQGPLLWYFLLGYEL